MRTYCTCGLWHEFREADEPPETINCEDCPICSGDKDEDDDFENYDFEKELWEQDD